HLLASLGAGRGRSHRSGDKGDVRKKGQFWGHLWWQICIGPRGSCSLDGYQVPPHQSGKSPLGRASFACRRVLGLYAWAMGTGSIRTSDSHRSGLMPRGGYLLALMVLVGSLVFVLVAWHYARERELHAAEASFVARTTEMVERLNQRLVYYELVARGGTALFASMARSTPQQWADYVDSLNLRARFPAAEGLGFVGYVSSNSLDDLQIEWRES